jgi:hypothetical protein
MTKEDRALKRILKAVCAIVVDRGSDFGRDANLPDLTVGDIFDKRLLRKIVKAALKTHK